MSQVREIGDKMFTAFDSRDLEGVISTFSKDTVLVHHGTQVMPSAKFKGLEGARMFFDYNFNAMKVGFSINMNTSNQETHCLFWVMNISFSTAMARK